MLTHTPNKPLREDRSTDKWHHRGMTARRCNNTQAVGGYGIVYKGVLGGLTVAVKRFKVQPDVAGFIGAIGEVDMVTRLAPLNCTPKLISIERSFPFDHQGSPIGDGMVDDTVSIITEYASEGNLGTAITTRSLGVYDIKRLIVDIIIAMHKIHNCGIIHRDVKPDNILLHKVNDVYVPLLCDFGQSCFEEPLSVKAAGCCTTVTRAPEAVIGCIDYSYKIDVWALGCVFYMMLTGMLLVHGTAVEPDIVLWQRIISTNPNQWSADKCRAMLTRARHSSYTRQSFVEAGNHLPAQWPASHRINVTEFDSDNSYGGTFKQFIDLLKRMLSIDPNDRPTTAGLLSDPYFATCRPYVLCQCNIIDDIARVTTHPRMFNYICTERRVMSTVACKTWNDTQRTWYCSAHAMFLAVDLFDRYMQWVVQHQRKRIVPKDQYEYLDHDSCVHKFQCCMWLAVRYYTPGDNFPRYDQVVSNKYTTESYRQKAVQFEHMLVSQVCKYQIYRPTILNYLVIDHGPTDHATIGRLLVAYTTWDTKDITSYADAIAVFRHNDK